MFVWPSARIPLIWPCRSPTPPSGCVRTTQWAASLKLTTPSSSRSVMAAAARRMASLPMSTFWTPAMPAPVAPVEGVAVAGVHRAGLVDDDDERDVRLLLAVAHAHVDRQRLLERGLLVAAGAVAVGSADHHQALAEVADVDLERGQLAVREADPRARRRGRRCRRWRGRRSRSGAPRGRSCRPAGAGSRGPRPVRRRPRRRPPGPASAARP